METTELARHPGIAQLLLDAARVLGETLEPDRVYETFHGLLVDAVPHDGVVVSSYDDGDELIRCEYAWSDGERIDHTTFPPLALNREGEGMQSRVIVSGESLLFNDVAEIVQRPGGTYYDVDSKGELRKLPDAGPPTTRAAMMVPVKHDGRVVGVVQLMSNTAQYSAGELQLLEGLVGQMAAAVRNARLQKERRRLEAAEAAASARASEREQAANVLQAVGDGVFLLDERGIVRLWNAAAELVTGLSAAEVCNRPIGEVLPEWGAIAPRIPIADDGTSARAVTLPLSLERGELWLSFVAVRSAEGVVYAFRDQTRERLLDEEKSDLSATISHELRTPIAAVYGAAQTLRRREAELTEDQRRSLVDIIANQSARLAQITEDVLLATQLDRDTLTLEPQRVDVGEVVRTTAEMMRSQLGHSVDIRLELEAEGADATGAPDRIQQVLVNLIDNAARYGGGEIELRVELANGFVRVLVRDSGPGISPADQERIFEKFYRSGPPLTRAPGGTGLGLYISRELVRRMGGQLELRSQLGAGSTFVVELPRAS